jgi:hypothetical protein
MKASTVVSKAGQSSATGLVSPAQALNSSTDAIFVAYGYLQKRQGRGWACSASALPPSIVLMMHLDTAAATAGSRMRRLDCFSSGLSKSPC